MNGQAQIFVRCYKLDVHGKKTGALEKDIAINAHVFSILSMCCEC